MVLFQGIHRTIKITRNNLAASASGEALACTADRRICTIWGHIWWCTRRRLLWFFWRQMCTHCRKALFTFFFYHFSFELILKNWKFFSEKIKPGYDVLTTSIYIQLYRMEYFWLGGKVFRLVLSHTFKVTLNLEVKVQHNTRENNLHFNDSWFKSFLTFWFLQRVDTALFTF